MIEKIIGLLWIVCNKLNQTIGGQKIVLLVRRTGVQRIMLAIYHNKHKKMPTNEMIKSRAFFEKNSARISNVLNMLSDEKSKEVYSKMIEFRQYCDVKKFPSFKEQNQYFPRDIISIDEDEVFIDCGAYNGDTVRSFLKFGKNQHKKIVCFEPDSKNSSSLKNFLQLENLSKVSVVNTGVWSKKDILYFSSGNAGGSSFVNAYEKNERLEVISIDELEICNDATFIKMDIEGAEMEALKGAQNTIKENKPKLAICIYHSNEEMICIAEYIKSLVPEYKLYVRQHNFDIAETVLYAII